MKRVIGNFGKRAYRDPTADMAIGKVMREYRAKQRRLREKESQKDRKKTKEQESESNGKDQKNSL